MASSGHRTEECCLEHKENQDRFKKEMGLLIDKPKPGFGNTNDGNTSRRVFENPALSASITGVDIEIIRRLNIILQVISCFGHRQQRRQ